MLYSSFIPLAAHVKKNRHKYQEDVTSSSCLKARRMHGKGQESGRPAHSPSCPEGMCRWLHTQVHLWIDPLERQQFCLAEGDIMQKHDRW